MNFRNFLNLKRLVRNKVILPGRVMFGAGDPTMHLVPEVIAWGANRSVFWLGMELVILEGAPLPAPARTRGSLAALLLLACIHFWLQGPDAGSAAHPVSASRR
jgi:hypothetical protein